MPDKPRKLLDQVRDVLRLKHYAIRTEEAYTDWIRRFILFHNKRHPREMGAAEITAFLTHLAVEQNVAASTQNPCPEPVEGRRSPPSFSSTAKFCTRISALSNPSTPRNRSVSRLSSPAMRCDSFWRKWTGFIN